MNYACKLSELVKLNKCNSSGKNLLVLDLFQKSSDIRRLDFFLLKNRNTILEVTGIALHINLNFQYFLVQSSKFLLSHISERKKLITNTIIDIHCYPKMMRKRCSTFKEASTNDDLSDLSLSDPDDKSDLRFYLKSTKNSRSRSYKSRKVESKPKSRDSTARTSSNLPRIQDESDVSDTDLQTYVKLEEMDSMKKSLDSDLDAYMMIARQSKAKSHRQEEVNKQLTYTKIQDNVEKHSEEKKFHLQKSVHSHTPQNRKQEKSALLKRIKDLEVKNEMLIKKLDNQYNSLMKKNELLNEKNSVLKERNSQLQKLFHDVNDKYISTRNELARRNDNLRSIPSAQNCDEFSFEYESCKSEVMKFDNIKSDKS